MKKIITKTRKKAKKKVNKHNNKMLKDNNNKNNKITNKRKNLTNHHKLYLDLLMKRQVKCQKNKNNYQKKK